MCKLLKVLIITNSYYELFFGFAYPWYKEGSTKVAPFARMKFILLYEKPITMPMRHKFEYN